MKVLILNTSDRTGGAAVASHRLMAALNNNGEKAKMMVRDKVSDDPSVVRMGRQWLMKWRFAMERLCILLRLRGNRQHLWEIDTASMGADITKTREFQEADVIHLAWVNQGMLSLSGIHRILQSGKPVVWTMHDLWPATALCHYARGCDSFKTQCQDCKLLPQGGSAKDLSYKTWERKKSLYNHSNIHFVTCSRWLEKQAKQSALFKGHFVTSVPNPIDTNVFCPQDKTKVRKALNLPVDKNIVLFVSQKVTDERKGAAYLVEALNKLITPTTENPQPTTFSAENTVVALLGGHSEELAQQITLPVHALGYVNGEQNLAQVYNAADVFVLPSLEDNLPNTLMEALACGVPCVAFNVGGIPEMIDHRKNGYVAEARNTDDLAQGLAWVLADADREALHHEALQKVARCYSQQSVAMRYVDVYSEAMAHRRYRL